MAMASSSVFWHQLLRPQNVTLLRSRSFYQPFVRHLSSSALSLAVESDTHINDTNEKDALLPRAGSPPTSVLTQLHTFPSLEPLSYTAVPVSLLYQPFRRDILWRAVVYENDNETDRQYMFTRNRAELGFSKRKMAPQKGRGRARVGKAGNPIFEHGAKTFGPRNPDDSTYLNRRIYNLALRVALSYTYKLGNLIVVDGAVDLPSFKSRASEYVWKSHGWNDEKILVVVADKREKLEKSLKKSQPKTSVVYMADVDIRTLLKAKKIVIEKEALFFLDENTVGKNYLNPLESSNRQDIVKERAREKHAQKQYKIMVERAKEDRRKEH
ncbi:ribosomal protein L4 domain-containing protein [Dipodascopsis uninucleata]